MKIRSIKLPAMLRNHSRRVTSYIALLGTVMAIVGLMSVYLLQGTAYASGGVGSGGSGGGSGVGHYTYYGWGWSIYDTNGPGPSDGFRNGSSWASAQATCQGANASQVYAFIILNSSGTGEIYDFQAVEEGPPQYAAHFSAGTVVDNGRSTAIDTAQAQSAFNSLPSYGVDTSGYSFGSNVGWFCYNFAQPKTTVGGHVYNTTTGTYMSGVQIATCMGAPNPANVFTDSNGYFGFTVDAGTGYCLRIVGGTAPGSYTSAYWYTQFPYNKYHPNISSYEWQLAGSNCFETGAEGNIFCGDRNIYWGYDMNWPNPPTFDSYGSQGMDFNVTNLSVQAHVFKVDASGNKIGDVQNATMTTTCANPGGGTVTTASNGFVYVPMSPGTSFCLRITSSAPVGYSGPFVRPWSQGYNSPQSGGVCPSLSPNPPNGYGGPPYAGHCDNPSYEWQVAGQAQNYVSRSASGPYPAGIYFDRNLLSGGFDGGYDFVYVRNSITDVCPNIAGVQVSAPAGYQQDSSGNCVQPNYPYLRVYGGDVLAGSDFGNCTANGTASIIGYNDGAGAGAAVQFATQAMTAINGVTSATLRSVAPKPKNGLSFANTNVTGDLGYGGGFGSAVCSTDYYGAKPSTTAITSPYDPSGNGSNNYFSNGSITVTAAANIANGVRQAVYVNGNVQISGTGIRYAGAGGGWTALSDISSFYLIVKGNIYIQKTVTQLDGVYIAQDDGSGTKGRIYTCANGTSLYAADQLLANCSTQLVINGAFMAKQVKFQRTNGSLYAQSASPYAWSGWKTLNANVNPQQPCGKETTNGYAPAVASTGVGKLDVFFINNATPAHLVDCSTTDADDDFANSVWTLTDLGVLPGSVAFASGPDAVSWGPGRIDIVVEGAGGATYHASYSGGTLSAWDNYGGCASAGPAISAWDVNRLDVTVSGCPVTAGMYHGAYNSPNWSGFVNGLGGQAVGSPAIVSWGPNRDDIFIQGTTHLLYHNFLNGGAFSGWLQEVTGNICSSPAATAPGMNQSFANRLDVFAMGCNGSNLNNGKLYQSTWTGSWGAFAQVDSSTSPTTDPAAVSWGDNRFDIFAFDGNQKLLWQYYDVVPRPNTAAATPTEASSSSNIAEVFNYSPELFLAPLSNSGTGTNSNIDSITSLPPIL